MKSRDLNTLETIVLACDHAGLDLKNDIKEVLEASDIKFIDVGTYEPASVDYPDYASRAVSEIIKGNATKGIIVCGSGIGVSIAANRHKEIRAALCQTGLMARLARQHNNANVLALGSRLIGIETAVDCIREFLSTDFEGGRHEKRVAKLSAKH